MSTKIDRQNALKMARAICAKQEQCKYDIRQKFAKWNLPKNEVDYLLEQLEKEGFINELRYSGS